MHVLFVQDEPHDKAFQAWLKENRTIACPTCGQGLQKQEGCNHLQYVPFFSQAVHSVLRMGFCVSSCALWPELCCQQIRTHLPFACCPLPLMSVYCSVCSVLHAPCAFSSPLCCLLCHSHMPCALLTYSYLPFLPAPAVVILLWAFATFSTSTALKVPSCLATWLLLPASYTHHAWEHAAV